MPDTIFNQPGMPEQVGGKEQTRAMIYELLAKVERCGGVECARTLTSTSVELVVVMLDT
jgi:hypothetical protein